MQMVEHQCIDIYCNESPKFSKVILSWILLCLDNLRQALVDSINKKLLADPEEGCSTFRLLQLLLFLLLDHSTPLSDR
jgi:hypothetical protein